MKKQIKIAIALMLIGGLLTTVAFVMSFTTAKVQPSTKVLSFPGRLDTVFELAPPQTQPGGSDVGYLEPQLSQKIFYFHVPVAEASFLIFTVAAIFAILFLMKKKQKYDTQSRIAMETALLFTVATMITGILWTKAAWGTWWEWEPRLTTYLLMMILMIAYFVLRNALDDEERRAQYSAVFCIVAWIDAPISFFITRLIPSTHPSPIKAGMDTSVLIPFIIAQLGMLAIGYGIYVLRAAEEETAERLEIIKEALEG